MLCVGGGIHFTGGNVIIMIKNRAFALGFRCTAFLACLFGVLYNITSGFSTFHGVLLLYYTIQSNIFAIALFGILIYKTAAGLKKDGVKGNSAYLSRISAGVTICIMLTFIVFWCVLAPFAGEAEKPFLFTYDNLSVHFIAPLLMLADYIMFSEGGKLKKEDPFLFAFVPIVYLIITLIIGFSGKVVFQIPGFERSASFPYFFIDYSAVGLWMLAYIVGLTVFYIGMGYFLLFIDGRRERKTVM